MILLVVLVALVAVAVWMVTKDNFWRGSLPKGTSRLQLLADRSQKHLSSASKCISCENYLIDNYGPEYATLGQNTKCFSCETDDTGLTKPWEGYDYSQVRAA